MPVLLEPAALVWRIATWVRRRTANPHRSGIPVMCIGNPTAGGAGKTPTAIAIGHMLLELGERPVFLTRGYGGRIAGPHLVDIARDGADDVGDEALLLARVAPAVVCGDRGAGARFIEEMDASVIVMDDGFHNPGIVKDFSVLVVDRSTGIGNGEVIPAGPLRDGLRSQFKRAQALLLVGQGSEGDKVEERALHEGIPVLEARFQATVDTDWIRNRPVIAFAGIGHPAKFFRDLDTAGARLERTFAFPDHHRFEDKDVRRLLSEADSLKADLVTTEKDWVRMERQTGAMFDALRKRTRPWPVQLAFSDSGKIQTLVRQALELRRAY